MDAVFSRVLQISFSGSVIVLAVLALRLMLRRAPRRAVCLLWMLAVLRLLVPIEIQSAWSLQPKPVEFSPAAVEAGYFDAGTAVAPDPPEYPEDAVEYPLQQVPERSTAPVEILPWVWITGVGVLGIHGVVSYLRLKRRVRDSVIWEEGVWVSPGLDTAFVLGFFRPQIYLPVLPEEDRELVLLHERQHIRRLDHWWKLAAYAAVSLHWFNPLAWVTYVLMCRDMELACDQETVKTMDNAKRKAYSAALLRCAVKRSGIAACPVAFGEISVKERIKMVLNYKKPGFWVTLVALMAAVAVGICLLTSPREMTDLQRCEEALKQWQGMDAYEFHQSQSNVGDGAENEWSVVDNWSCDGAHLMRFSYAEDLGFWQHWKNGKSYIRDFGSADAQWEDTNWHETESQENVVVPWIMRLDWNELTVHSWESAEDGKTVMITVDFPTLGPGTLSFHFDESGALWSVSRSFSHPSSVVSSGTIELVSTDRAQIEGEMDRFGVVPELVQLYSELERIQGQEHIHLITDVKDETGDPKYDSARQEFIRWGNNYYRNYENHGSKGGWVVTALKYGGKIYVRQHSDDGAAPNMDWKQDDSREYDNIMLLKEGWDELQVSEIRQEEGDTVITLQRDVAQANNGVSTYYTITYDFRLDGAGNLISLTYSDYSEVLREEGVFEGPYQAVTYILDTPAEELEQRILETMVEVKEAQAVAAVSGS